MKKIIFLVLLVCTFIIPTCVCAKNEKIEILCDNVVYANKVNSCTVKVVSDDSITGTSFKVELSNNLTLKELTLKKGLFGTTNENKLAFASANGVGKDVDIATIKFEVKSSSSPAVIKVSNVAVATMQNNIPTDNFDVEDASVEFDTNQISGSTSSSSPLIPIGIAVGVVVVGAILIVLAKKKK